MTKNKEPLTHRICLRLSSKDREERLPSLRERYPDVSSEGALIRMIIREATA